MGRISNFFQRNLSTARLRARYWLQHPQERAELLAKMAAFAARNGNNRAALRLDDLSTHWKEVASVGGK